MPTLFVRHTVADYAAWRKVYDDFAPVQKAAGVTSQGIYQAVDNPNDVTVYHEFGTIEQVQGFLAGADLKAAMERAGVQGPPTIWVTNRS